MILLFLGEIERNISSKNVKPVSLVLVWGKGIVHYKSTTDNGETRVHSFKNEYSSPGILRESLSHLSEKSLDVRVK